MIAPGNPMPPAAGLPLLVVVEDNPADVELLRVALDGCPGHDPLLLTDGESAVAYIAASSAERPTLFVVDLNLPRRNGFEVLEAIATAPSRARLARTVVLTSSPRASDRARALELGAEALLSKPASLDQLQGLGETLCRMLSELARS